MKCLIADDSMTMRRIVIGALKALGYDDVIEAADGKEALAKCDASIDLVVIDHLMPRMSGVEVIRELRRRPARLPIILMSGLSPAETGIDLAGPAALQPDAFLRKPFDLVNLARTLREAIDATGAGSPWAPAEPLGR